MYASSCDLHLPNVLHTPHLNTKLIFDYKLCADNIIFIEFHSNFFCIKDRASRKLLHQGPIDKGLYNLLENGD